VSYAEGSKFSELSLNQIHTMMTVNCYTMTLLTKCVLDSFKRRFAGSKAKSLIINHCAAASLAPMPYVQVYSATKIFCDFMTEGLNYELKEFGVDVMGIRSFGISEKQQSWMNVTH
jgi:short-subunit dehydrogenase